MRIYLITIILVLITFTAYSQSITIGEDGIVRCKDVPIGTRQTIAGSTYQVVDYETVIVLRFQGADLSKLCVSNITSMAMLFFMADFNGDINNWDVSNVTDMTLMFAISTFNKPLNKWNVGKVTDMKEMFTGASFNQPIDNWDVSKVTDMSDMFTGSEFNQPIGSWNVGNVKSMSYMFHESPFNQPIGDWDVSKVTDMGFMFAITDFNQPIGNWDVRSVVNMESIFAETPFNQEIGDWNVSSVENMEFMFSTSMFNKPLAKWNTDNVENMDYMFANSPFNQPINTWCVAKILTEPQFFSTFSPLTAANKPVWGSCANPTSIEGTELVTVFTLDQNYPNPFNPTTTIRFGLPESEQVTIRVYDVNGRMIAELVNNQMYTAGNHQLTFDASGLSTGVYIYNLTTNSGFTMSRKLVLIK
jgi:surface protein